jgi:PAP2 superfamily
MDPSQAQTPTSAPAAPTSGWRSRVWERIRFHTLLKTVGTTAFMVVFFRAYFALLENPRHPPTVLPEIWLDHWVDFTPAAFPVYLSLWVYVSLAPALMGNLRALLWFGAWVGALCLLCLGVFWAWPTQTPPFGVDWGLYPGLALIKGTDAAGNAFPSLHVASAVFSACWLHRILRQLRSPSWILWASALQCLAITWSTMATLQHVALDVFSGLVVGLLFAAASLIHIRRTD